MSAEEDTAAASNDAVWFNVSERIIYIENDYYQNYNASSSFEYILVPEGINIFPLLGIEIPKDVMNLSSWKVGVSNLNPIYEQLQDILGELRVSLFFYTRYICRKIRDDKSLLYSHISV